VIDKDCIETRFLQRVLTYSLLIFPFSASSSDFGTTGLITIPTARMQSDGDFSLTAGRNRVVDLVNLTYQATPWAEFTFRYSIFNPRREQGNDYLRDRSWEGKLRILRESRYVPQIALGAKDMFGTGAWSSEYLVSSKHMGPFDITLGLGWGRYAERGSFKNPLSVLTPRFDNRQGWKGGTGGTLSSNFLTGNAALFGGVSYEIPRLPITIMAQYNSDAYNRETRLGSLKSPSAISYGLDYEFFKNTTISVSHQQGEYWGLRFTTRLETKTMPKIKPSTRFYSSNASRSLSNAPETLNLDSWYDRLLYDVERSGLLLNQARWKPGLKTAEIELSNESYALTAHAVKRALLLSEIHLPEEVKTIDLFLKENDLMSPTIRYSRLNRDMSDGLPSRSLAESDLDRIRILPASDIKKPTNRTNFGKPKLDTSLDLAFRMQVMDPDKPFKKQVYAKLAARLSLAEGWNLWGTYAQDIFNDFDTIRGPNSNLPHVRTEVNYYLTRGASGIDSLFLENRNSLSPALHYRLYVGLLEEMFSGLGGEILYEPYRKRWAIGFTTNVLKKRDYDKTFKHLDYETTTRYLSFYYATPFYNFDLALHAGRYLAKDDGYTFEARRTFDNGFSIGAFFTRTNVPAKLFGEGSFDKGLYFKIPFNSLLPGNSKASYSTIMRPTERDGGRRLDNFSSTLWFERRNVRYDGLASNKQLMHP